MPIGDKALQDVRLPPYIIKGPTKLKCVYLSELIPEDGSFHVKFKSNAGQFEWSRVIALHAGNKAERYQFISKIDKECIKFLLRFSTIKELTFGSSSQVIKVSQLSFNELDHLTEFHDVKVAKVAQRLKQRVLENPCLLIDDEARLCRSLGIGVVKYPRLIGLYKKSGRVSVVWRVYTRQKRDALRFGLLAPPHDLRKNAAFSVWARSNPELLKHVADKLQQEGLHFTLPSI